MAASKCGDISAGRSPGRAGRSPGCVCRALDHLKGRRQRPGICGVQEAGLSQPLFASSKITALFLCAGSWGLTPSLGVGVRIGGLLDQQRVSVDMFGLVDWKEARIVLGLPWSSCLGGRSRGHGQSPGQGPCGESPSKPGLPEGHRAGREKGVTGVKRHSSHSWEHLARHVNCLSFSGKGG